MKIVVVTWRDSHRYTYQMEADEEVACCTIKTVGWLVSENEKQIVLSQDDIEGDIRGVIVIPRENIVGLVDPTVSVESRKMVRVNGGHSLHHLN